MAVYAVATPSGRLENIQKLAAPWMNSLKVHAAALPLAEFTGVIGSLRGARFWPRQRLANHVDLWCAG